MSEKMMGLEHVGPQIDHLQKTDELKNERLTKFIEKCKASEYWNKNVPGLETWTIGALIERLILSNEFKMDCDAAEASLDLWHTAKENPLAYIEKAFQ